MLAFLNISTSELLIVLMVVLLLFGPQKLPEIVRFIGKVINQVKHASEEVKREISQASTGFDKDVRDAADEIRKEAEQVKKQVLEAVPRQSMRTFEKAASGDSLEKKPSEAQNRDATESTETDDNQSDEPSR